MIVVLSQGHLQPVVVGVANIGKLVDETQERKLGGIGPLTGSRVRLVDVGDRGQSCAVVANIGNVQANGAREAVLHTYGPTSDVRGLEIWDHTQDSACRCCAATDGGPPGENLAVPDKARPRKKVDARRDRAPTRLHALSSGRDRTDATRSAVLGSQLPQEFPQKWMVVNENGPRSDRRAPLPGGIPRDAETRRKVGAIRMEGRTDLFAHLDQSDVRIEVAQQVVSFGWGCEVFVTQPRVQGQLRGDAPIVLSEPRIRPLSRLVSRISNQQEPKGG